MGTPLSLEEPPQLSWFETREFALLTMRAWTLPCLA
jgi:hypothetical protein